MLLPLAPAATVLRSSVHLVGLCNRPAALAPRQEPLASLLLLMLVELPLAPTRLAQAGWPGCVVRMVRGLAEPNLSTQPYAR